MNMHKQHASVAAQTNKQTKNIGCKKYVGPPSFWDTSAGDTGLYHPQKIITSITTTTTTTD
jgi:hypothetical protein